MRASPIPSIEPLAREGGLEATATADPKFRSRMRPAPLGVGLS